MSDEMKPGPDDIRGIPRCSAASLNCPRWNGTCRDTARAGIICEPAILDLKVRKDIADLKWEAGRKTIIDLSKQLAGLESAEKRAEKLLDKEHKPGIPWEFEPDAPVHVWGTIKEALDARGLDFRLLMGWTRRSAEVFKQELPDIALSPYDAGVISTATGIPASFFLNLQAAYYKDLARKQEREEREARERTGGNGEE